MNILIVVDKYQSAIHRLALSVEKYNPHLNIKIYPVHPKRNDIEVLHTAQQLLNWADLIDIHYWKSGEVLRTSFPQEFESKPRIVCHFNPYDYDKLKFQDIYDACVVGNSSIQANMPFAYLIPYGIDLNFWKYEKEHTEDKHVNMVVARIEGKKGVLEVAEACKDLGYKLTVVGRVSDGEYMQKVLSTGSHVTFIENATDEQLRDLYYSTAVHVCNSVDDFESGTLPILEAMACGCPVLTRDIGHVPDLFNGENMSVRKGQPDDMDDLKTHLEEIVENRSWRMKMREKAWETVKNRTGERMARQFSQLYYKVAHDRPLVSVIVPTFDRPDTLIDCLAHVVTQKYTNLEIVVADSGNTQVEQIIRKFRNNTKIPIKYIRFENNGEYTLLKARNLAVMEAEGEFLVFCDDRLAMENTAIDVMAENLQRNTWVWGIKDGYRKGFVENFSAVRREDFIAGGMFNERIDGYGGCTQEIRERFEKRQGFAFIPVEANAKAISKSSSKHNKKESIWQSKLKLWKLYGANI